MQGKIDGTKKAMADLGIYYPQLLDSKQEMADRYDFHSIPHLLLRHQRQIVKHSMRDDETDALLKTTFQ